MAAPDNLHSRVVAWLKVILPLLALALLSTLFLVARGGDPADLPFSQADLEEMASGQNVDRPNFAGTTEEGRAIMVTALTATPRPDDMNTVDTTMMHGTLETGEDSSIAVTSEEGTVFGTDNRALLQGNVLIETSTGYTIRTQELTTALDRTDMKTTADVTAEGPLGRIDAGQMIVTPGSDGTEDVSVVFKGGVKLIYLPQNQ